jgi:hypothetical protein
MSEAERFSAERANLLKKELEQLVVEAKRLGLKLDDVTGAIASHWSRLGVPHPAAGESLEHHAGGGESLEALWTARRARRIGGIVSRVPSDERPYRSAV